MISSMIVSPPDPTFVLRGSQGSVTALSSPSEGNDHLFSGHLNGVIQQWDLTTRRVIHKLNMFADLHSEPSSILWLHQFDADTLYCQSRGGLIQRWNRQSQSQWNKSASFESGTMGFCPCEITQLDGHDVLLVATDTKSEINIIDLETGKVVNSIRPEGMISTIDVHANRDTTIRDESDSNKHGMCMILCAVRQNDMSACSDVTEKTAESSLLVGYEDGSIALFDLHTGACADTLHCHDESVMAMHYNSTKNRGFSASVDKTIVSWTIKDNKLVKLKEVEITNKGCGCVCIRRDCKIVATGGWDGRVRLFGFKQMKPLAVLTYHSDSIQALTFGAGNTMFAGSADGHISVWNIY